MTGSHSRIIAAAAKPELDPFKFKQKGRSRLWIADRGSWLNIVEFTPSRWSKSVSLMNAVHWLWIGAGFTSHNENVSSKCHADFENEDQFREAMVEIAKAASAEALKIDQRFSSFEAIAAHIVQRARSSPERMARSWWGYEAGIASGIVGRFEEARKFLDGVTDDRVTGRAARFLSLIANPDAFRSKVNDLVAEERARLQMKPLDSLAF